MRGLGRAMLEPSCHVQYTDASSAVAVPACKPWIGSASRRQCRMLRLGHRTGDHEVGHALGLLRMPQKLLYKATPLKDVLVLEIARMSP